MLELAPGIPAIEVLSPYQVAHHAIHGRESEASGVPLRVQTRARPASFVVSFPATGPVQPPPELPVLAWVTRADIELVSGDATLAYLGSDHRQVFDEQRIATGEPTVHIVTADIAACASVVIRAGTAAQGETVVLVGPFQLFAVADDEATILRMPPGVELAPMQRWNRFFGYPGRDLGPRLRYLRYEQLTAPRAMRWLEDLEVVIAPGEQISRAVYVSGVYEPCTLSVLRELLNPGETFVDVGANIGLFSLLAARWVGAQGRVVALEPSQREYRRLLDHIDRNRFAHVAAYRVGAGDARGTAVLRVADQAHSGLNTLEPTFAYADVAQDHEEQVEVMTLDDLLARDSVGDVHVMKIDVEGSEHRVVAGARQTIERSRPAVILEVAGAALDPAHAGRQSMEALLRSYGYVFAAIDADEARLTPVPGLLAAAENIIAAPPRVVERLLQRFGTPSSAG